jgi:hypothetical protein
MFQPILAPLQGSNETIGYSVKQRIIQKKSPNWRERWKQKQQASKYYRIVTQANMQIYLQQSHFPEAMPDVLVAKKHSSDNSAQHSVAQCLNSNGQERHRPGN